MGGAGGYEEVLALEFFMCAVRNDDWGNASDDFFEPFVRNLENGELVFHMKDLLCPNKARGARSPAEAKLLQICREGVKYGRTAEEQCAACWDCRVTRNLFRRWMLSRVEERLAVMRERTAQDPLRQRIAELQNTLRLSDEEMKIVLALWLANTRRLQSDELQYRLSGGVRTINLYTRIGEQVVRAAFCNSGRLCRYGVIANHNNWDVSTKIRNFLEGISDEPLASSFYRKDTDEVLPMPFFGELAEKHLPVLKKLLAAKREHGLNILLYGAPGTGKTSFARALAKEMGRTCFQIAQRPKDRDGDYTAAKAEIRYAALEICDDQIVTDASLVVVDEADALLRCASAGMLGMSGSAGEATGDKGLLNDILEKNKAPRVWITNTDADELDLSNRRRFDYSIRFEPLTKRQRLAIWKNASAKAGIPDLLTKREIVRLIDRYPVSTGIVARALENVASVEGTRAERKTLLTRLLDRQRELSGEERNDAELPSLAKDYSLDGLNIKSKVSLDKVVRAARRFADAKTARRDRDAPRFNILLSGAPGSGKTEFVKYLASQLGRPLCVRRASDLKSMWVGETEKNIAAAFRTAKEKKAILFFDEVDTFLDNREALGQGHEKSMINEVLQQMENFGGIFVGATNFTGMLDPAVARRFTFKIELDYLTAEGKRRFFRKFFDTELSKDDEEELDRIDKLTPGDFRTVRQELYYLGDEVANADRLSALEEEVRAKSAGSRSRIGFAV